MAFITVLLLYILLSAVPHILMFENIIHSWKTLPFLVVEKETAFEPDTGTLSLGRENITLPVSGFSGIEYLDLDKIDKRLDSLDPRRTPFIDRIIKYFDDTEHGVRRYLVENNKKNRDYLRKNRIIVYDGSDRSAYFPEGLFRSFCIIFLMILPFITDRRFVRKISLLLLLPWLWVAFLPSGGTGLAVIGILGYYSSLILNNEKRNNVNGYGYFPVFYLLSAIVSTIIAISMKVPYQVSYVLASACTASCLCIGIEDFLSRIIDSGRIHPVFVSLPIMPESARKNRPVPGVYFLFFIVLFGAVFSMKLQKPDSGVPVSRGLPENVSMREFYKNAAFQYGYMYNYGYNSPSSDTPVMLTVYHRNKEGIDTGHLVIEEFTDEWYEAIISHTHPMLLAFLDSGTVVPVMEMFFGVRTGLYLMFPVIFFFLFRVYPAGIHLKDKKNLFQLMNSQGVDFYERFIDFSCRRSSSS